jgi:exopolyphosphatase/guanosine-5'-triphosphate,3'-diphosphate pyrophosphatase
VLRRVLRATGARRVVFSANGIREGWYMRRVPSFAANADPVLAASRDLGNSQGRDATLPLPLFAWTAPLFPYEAPEAIRLREAACWLSDVGNHDHPEYRAEQSFLRVLRQPGIALDHHGRAFLALTLAFRYEADPMAPFLEPARLLLDPAEAQRAELLGHALRLAYTLSAGTPELLASTALEVEPGRLVLRLARGGGAFAGESVLRRLERLGEALGLAVLVETRAPIGTREPEAMGSLG